MLGYGKTNCYTGSTGADYRGKVNTTDSGKTCVDWSKYDSEEFYSSSKHVKNYCRGGDSSTANKPWCYTDEGGTQETCPTPRCPCKMKIPNHFLSQFLVKIKREILKKMTHKTMTKPKNE